MGAPGYVPSGPGSLLTTCPALVARTGTRQAWGMSRLKLSCSAGAGGPFRPVTRPFWDQTKGTNQLPATEREERVCVCERDSMCLHSSVCIYVYIWVSSVCIGERRPQQTLSNTLAPAPGSTAPRPPERLLPAPGWAGPAHGDTSLGVSSPH